MSFDGIFASAGSAMNAQTVRLNTISSNLANVNTAASSPEAVFKPLKPVFVTNQTQGLTIGKQSALEVMIADVVPVQSQMERKLEPNHPLADEQGYVYYPGISAVDEMADMMSATRSFEAAVNVMSNATRLQQELVKLLES